MSKEIDISAIKKALERVINDASLGIATNDHELMNPENFNRVMNQHFKDVETLKEGLVK